MISSKSIALGIAFHDEIPEENFEDILDNNNVEKQLKTDKNTKKYATRVMYFFI